MFYKKKETQKKSLNRVFDYIGPYGIIPNGLNYNYLDSYLKYDFNQGYNLNPYRSDPEADPQHCR